MSRTSYAIFGCAAGGSWGALGFLGGPVLGTITTAGSMIVGTIAGYHVGPCCDDAAVAVEKIKETVGNTSKTVASANETVNGVSKTVDGVKNIATTANGAIILTIGLSLGLGMWLMGADCNPSCTNQNTEYIRLTATALATIGVAVIGISGIKSIFSN